VRLMLAPLNKDFIVARDAAALAEALLGLLRLPDLRREIGAANRARAEREYDQEAMFAAWAAVFDGASA
jgi:glycosyltransferase involved in cell wall biosynthesis